MFNCKDFFYEPGTCISWNLPLRRTLQRKDLCAARCILALAIEDAVWQRKVKIIQQRLFEKIMSLSGKQIQYDVLQKAAPVPGKFAGIYPLKG